MSQKPIHEIRLGRVRAAIWENETTHGIRRNVTFSRLYRDEQGNWGDSSSFGRDDLPLLCKVADCAHTWIMQQPYTPAQPAAQGDAQSTDAPSSPSVTVDTPF